MQLTAHLGPRTSACLGIYSTRSGRILEQAGQFQEITPLPGINFLDGWRVQPTLNIPTNLPITKDAPCGTSIFQYRTQQITRRSCSGHPQKMDPTHVEQQSERASIFVQWWNMAISSSGVRCSKNLCTTQQSCWTGRTQLCPNSSPRANIGTLALSLYTTWSLATSFFFVGALCLSAGYHLRLTCGPAGNRTTTGSLSAVQEAAIPTEPRGHLPDL